MNKLIFAVSVFVLSGYFSDPIQTAAASDRHSSTAISRHTVAKSHKLRHHHKKTPKNDQRGTASWYGSEFHGKKTASGQKFDMYAMSAAHKTLPLLSYAKVTNLENHRSVIVRINDRGPFHGKRDMDLSYAAAKKIGIRGIGAVAIIPLGRDPTLPKVGTGNKTS